MNILQIIRRKIKSNDSFSFDVLKLFSGTSLGQSFVLITAPIVTRLYSPADFGDLSIFISIVSIFGVVVCLRYQMAMLIPDDNDEAATVLLLCFASIAIVTLISVFLIIIFGNPFLTLINAPTLKSLLWLVPLAVAIQGTNLALYFWNTRKRKFTRMSLSVFLNKSSYATTQVGLGFLLQPLKMFLIGAYPVGALVSAVFLIVSTLKEDLTLFVRNINIKRIIQVAFRYRKFPQYDLWSVLLNTISWQLPSFMLSAYFSSTIVGYYSFGNRLIRVPMSLVGQAISQVFFQRASKSRIDGDLSDVVEDVFNRLVRIGLIPILILTIIGRELFVVVFGPQWSEAGVYVQIMAIWTFFWFISSPLSSIFRVLEKQEISLRINIAIFLTRLISLWVGGVFESARLAIFLFAGTGLILYSYLGASILKIAEVPLKRGIKIIFTNFTHSIPTGLVLFSLKLLSIPNWLLLVIAGVAVSIHLYLNRNAIIRGGIYINNGGI